MAPHLYSRFPMSRVGRLLGVTLTLVLAAPVTSAFAQSRDIYTNPSVTVGPQANGSRVLLYPGGKYERIVPPLLQPGAPYPGTQQPIHLHMPTAHRQAEAESTPAPKKTSEPRLARTAPPSQKPEAAAPKPKKKEPVRAAEASPPPKNTTSKPAVSAPAVSTASNNTADTAAIPFSFGGSSTTDYSKPEKPAPATAAPVASAPPPQPAQTPPPKRAEEAPPARPEPQPTKVATLPPKPQSTVVPKTKSAEGKDMSRMSRILFGRDATEPAPAAAAGLTALAGNLTDALNAGADRVQLDAYGGQPGDKSSDARRISLKRALTIRQILIDNGVPSSRIDVRAMGGVEDTGPRDRVDVYVRS